jgi:hypothetical protein
MTDHSFCVYQLDNITYASREAAEHDRKLLGLKGDITVVVVYDIKK